MTEKPTRIRITATPDAVSDDLEWEVVDDHTSTVYESVQEQPVDVTAAEYADRQLVRDGVYWYRIEENLGAGQKDWWREAGRASSTDSWRNKLVTKLDHDFGAEDDECRTMFPDLPVGTLLDVHDDYWGDGEWTIVSIEKLTVRYLVCNRLLDPETNEHCEFDGDIEIHPNHSTYCPACDSILIYRPTTNTTALAADNHQEGHDDDV